MRYHKVKCEINQNKKRNMEKVDEIISDRSVMANHPNNNNDKNHVLPIDSTQTESCAKKIENSLEFCCDKDNCLSLDDILRSFNAPLSEEQAWSLIYQTVLLYRNFIRIEFIDKNTKKDSNELSKKSSHRIKVPKSPKNLNIHKDGSVHINDKSE